jgi:acyl dehydratase
VTFDMSVVGRWSAPHVCEVTPESVAAYEAVVGGTSPLYAVVPAMDLVFAVAETAVAGDPALRARVVHGQQDLVFHRPLPVGEKITLRAAIVGLHGKGSGTTATVKIETVDADGDLLNEQYVTEFYRGVPSEWAVGRPAPPTGLPRSAPDGEPVLVESTPLGVELPRRYADASGDHNPIHLDEEYARAAGLPGVIVHGLAVLAIAVRGVSSAAGDRALTRVSARFTRPVAPGSVLTTKVWDSAGGWRFEAYDDAGAPVLGAGLATV